MDGRKPMDNMHDLNNTCPISELRGYLNGHHYTKQEKLEFALFLKVMLRCLEKSQQLSMQQQARLIIFTCIRGCKIGDSSFYPLIEAIQLRLKKLVGDRIWKQAKAYTRFYLDRKSSLVNRCRPKISLLEASYTEQI